jgi:hypothetical protein
MLLSPVNEPAPALLAKRMNESSRDGLGQHLVAGIEALGGHDPQGKLTSIQRPAGERFLAKIDRLATLEAAINVNIRRISSMSPEASKIVNAAVIRARSARACASLFS